MSEGAAEFITLIFMLILIGCGLYVVLQFCSAWGRRDAYDMAGWAIFYFMVFGAYRQSSK